MTQLHKVINWLAVAFIVIVLAGVFYLGYRTYPMANILPEPLHDTVYIYDTLPHEIPDSFPYYVEKIDSVKYIDKKVIDSIIRANKVDTTEILRRYYAEYTYQRSFNDSLISAVLTDTISQNSLKGHRFTYKLLQPQSVITNKTELLNTSLYIGVGTSVKLNTFNPEILLTYPKGYFGVEYNSINNGFYLKTGVRIWSKK